MTTPLAPPDDPRPADADHPPYRRYLRRVASDGAFLAWLRAATPDDLAAAPTASAAKA